MELRIGRRALAALLILVLLAGAIIVFGMIGTLVTPRDGAGRPVLLLPDVAAVVSYRASVRGWAAGLRAEHAELSRLLDAAGPGDPYAASKAADAAYDRAQHIAETIEVAPEPPASMSGIWVEVRDVAALNLEAAGLVAAWVGAPDESFYEGAVEVLALAGEGLDRLEANAWLEDGSGTTIPVKTETGGQETSGWNR